jgi:hypothetical protein
MGQWRLGRKGIPMVMLQMVPFPELRKQGTIEDGR